MELAVNLDDQDRNPPLAGEQKPVRANALIFDSAELRASPTLGEGLYLVVKGPAPKAGMRVRLLPALGEPVPEYRRIEIVADETGVTAPASDQNSARYEKSMPLSGMSGTRGIELVGANGIKRFDLIGI